MTIIKQVGVMRYLVKCYILCSIIFLQTTLGTMLKTDISEDIKAYIDETITNSVSALIEEKAKQLATSQVTAKLDSWETSQKLENGISFTGNAADKIINLISKSCECQKKEQPKKEQACKVSRPSDCSDLNNKDCASGIYKIYPDKTSGFEAFCDMETDGGGWTVFQRRMNGKTNFYREWEPYKHGFGNLKEEFWLGNEHIHQLTSQGNYVLRIELQDFENKKRYAEYKTFNIGDEKSGYTLSIDGYQGNAGDALKDHNGQKFTTKDRDNDSHSEVNCAKFYKGAWWYKACHHSNLNGLYLKGSHKTEAVGVNWKPWLGYYYSLKETTMMIRRA